MHAPDSVRGSVDGASFNLLTIKNQQSCRSNLARAHQPNQPTRRSQSCPSGERRGPHGPRALVSGNRARSIRLPSGPEARRSPPHYLSSCLHGRNPAEPALSTNQTEIRKYKVTTSKKVVSSNDLACLSSQAVTRAGSPRARRAAASDIVLRERLANFSGIRLSA